MKFILKFPCQLTTGAAYCDQGYHPLKGRKPLDSLPSILSFFYPQNCKQIVHTVNLHFYYIN